MRQLIVVEVDILETNLLIYDQNLQRKIGNVQSNCLSLTRNWGFARVSKQSHDDVLIQCDW